MDAQAAVRAVLARAVSTPGACVASNSGHQAETVIVFKVETDREGPVTLEQFASIGEIIGALGVIISLIYLARQIRSNEVWAGWKRLMLFYHSRPGFQTWWEYRRDVYSEPFAHFLETEKPDRKIPSYYEISNLQSASSGTDDE